MVFLSTLLISMFITMALIPILRMAAVRLHDETMTTEEITRNFQGGVGLGTEMHNWWRLEPAHELIRNQPSDVTRRMVLARSAAGDLAVAYLPDNEAIEVNMSQFPAPLAGRWFDPVRGRYTPLPDRVANQGIHRFTPPANGDWVLLLERK